MSYIERNVMSSVAMVYLLRKATGPFALKLYTLALCVAGIAMLASLGDVATNLAGAASSGPQSIGLYIFSAITSTEMAVQLALLLGTVAAASLFLDFVRAGSFNRLRV